MNQYPENWDTIRKTVYKRANYTCQICGNKGGLQGDTELHAHHKIPISNGGSHQMSNLECLCSECHSRVHGRPIGNSSSLDLTRNNTKSQEDTSSTESTDIGDLREASLELASVSFKLLYHLGQIVANNENVSAEEEISEFIESFRMGKLYMWKFGATAEQFEIGDGSKGLRGLKNAIDNRVERSSYALIGNTYQPIYDSLNDLVPKVEEVTDNELIRREATNVLNDVKYDIFLHVVSIQRADFAARGITSEAKTKPNGSTSTSGSKTASEEWSKCPNCGFEYSVLNIDEDVRRCFLCGTVWELTGLIWKKWKCTSCEFHDGNDITGKKRKSEKWLEEGKKANNQESYRKLDQFTTKEVANYVITIFELYNDGNNEVSPDNVQYNLNKNTN